MTTVFNAMSEPNKLIIASLFEKLVSWCGPIMISFRLLKQYPYGGSRLNFDGGTGGLCRVGDTLRLDGDWFCRSRIGSDIGSALRNGADIRRINKPGYLGIWRPRYAGIELHRLSGFHSRGGRSHCYADGARGGRLFTGWLNFDAGTGRLCWIGHAPRRDCYCFCRLPQTREWLATITIPGCFHQVCELAHIEWSRVARSYPVDERRESIARRSRNSWRTAKAWISRFLS